MKVTSLEEYIEVNNHFAKELTLLCNIINETELEETLVNILIMKLA